MNRLAKCSVVGLVLVPAVVFAQSAQTIYKFVDESGRVTYANSPIKGGAKLDLEPLTVIPSAPALLNASTPAARAVPVARVTSVASPTFSLAAVSVQPTTGATIPGPTAAPAGPLSAAKPPTTIAALETADKVQERAQQRRADIRKRILQSEIGAEEKSLDEARAALAETQLRSGDMRAMRASFAPTVTTASAQKPLISPEVRAEVERHFERIRNLQDQVAMHEGSIAVLREEMAAKR